MRFLVEMLLACGKINTGKSNQAIFYILFLIYNLVTEKDDSALQNYSHWCELCFFLSKSKTEHFSADLLKLDFSGSNVMCEKRQPQRLNEEPSFLCKSNQHVSLAICRKIHFLKSKVSKCCVQFHDLWFMKNSRTKTHNLVIRESLK